MTNQAQQENLAVQHYATKNLLSNEEAAEYLGVTPRTLEVWRCTKRHNIPYIKVGRLVKYRQIDLDDWLAAHTMSDGFISGGA